jgi:hypothetical protein
MISESENANGGDEQQEGSVSIGSGGVSNRFLRQNIGSFPASHQRFYDGYGPRFNMKWMLCVYLKTFCDVALVQLIVDEMKRYAEQEILNVNPFTFCCRIRIWKDVTVDETNVILALFMLIGLVQKQTPSLYYSKNWLLLHFSEALPLGRLIPHLSNRFQNLYFSNQNIAVDVSFTL